MKARQFAEADGLPLSEEVVLHPHPMVSVITIFLNAERFIQEAIESVFAQTYSHWELLLVDDGSTDASTGIALQCAQRHAGRIRYLEHAGHANRGMSASRNLGISQARGKYIAFLDADDIWLPHKLEQQVAILESQPEAAMVYGPVLMWYGWTGDAEDRQRDFIQRNLGVPLDTLVKPPMLVPFLLERARRGATPTTTGMLLRREAIERTGGFEEAFRGMFEDMVFATNICLTAPVFVAGECWLKYRQHPDSSVAIAMQTNQFPLTQLAFLHWLESYLSRCGIRDREVWAALQRKLWPYRHPIRHRLGICARSLEGRVKGLLRLVAQHILPVRLYDWLRLHWRRYAH